jgi:magnesium transporter
MTIQAPTGMQKPADETLSTSSLDSLTEQVSNAELSQALAIIESIPVDTAARVLKLSSPPRAHAVWRALPTSTRDRIATNLPSAYIRQWVLNASFPEGSVGRLMEPPQAVFPKEMVVSDAIANLRELVKREFITYIYISDENNRLQGLVVMRDLLFARPDQRLGEVMMSRPFTLHASTKLMDAMHQVLLKHFPVYPVVDEDGHILGLVRGFRMFEAQAIEISAQAGSMVGVEKEERISTPWLRSFTYRHPWLQLNLLTAFVAGAVVNFFQATIDQVVVLASFLPVLAGQSGNTGCQALAVTLRAMTLGELQPARVRRVIAKEALLGFANGALVGLSAAVGMYLLARSQGNPQALILSLIVLCAMMGGCCVSGLSGALVPLLLKRLGADPATASSIFLTTATDVASMGLLLWLATAVLL